MSEMQALVSIVVPVYNMEKYLDRCIGSILDQTYSRIELILVDDGSTDRSAQMCDEYSNKDCRVKVLHQKNRGQGAARNAGIDIAEGEYLGFADSDDQIVPDMIEFFTDIMQKHSADIAIGKMFRDAEEPQPPLEYHVMNKDEFYPLLLTDSISSHPCNKLFKKSLWEGIRYPERNSVDDMMIMPLLFDRSKTVVDTNKNVYLYFYNREDSVSNNPKTLYTNTFERFIAFKKRYEIATRIQMRSVYHPILKQATGFAVGAFGGMRREPEKYKNDLEQIQEFVRKYKTEISANPMIDRQRKFAVTVIRNFPCLYPVLFSIFRRKK